MTEYFHGVDGNASLFEIFHFLYSILVWMIFIVYYLSVFQK